MKNIFSRSIKALGAVTALLFVSSATPPHRGWYPGKSIYDFEIKSLDGKKMSLSKFKGKKMLIVNVASECGYTPQYKGLEELQEKYGSKVTVIGFPCNDFGGQEPGTPEQIQTFCSKNYGVTFPIMEKISVKGKDMHPIYRWLSSKADNGVTDESPNWNFCKYLIDENGKVIKFFKSKTEPMSEEITSLL